MHAILGYVLADLLARALPARWAERLAVAGARAAFHLRVPARLVVERNLARVRPDLSAGERTRLARRSFEQFARSFAEFLRPDRRDARARIRVRGGRHLKSALAAGRGVIVLSAHAGNWEWGAAYLAAVGRRLHVIARPHPSAWVERYVQRRREARGVGTLPAGRLWPDAARALRRGEWLAMMGDRAPAGSRRPPCAWAAALARRTGAILLPAVIVRTGPGRYDACFSAPLSPDECVAGGYSDFMMRCLKPRPAQWQAFEALPGGWA